MKAPEFDMALINTGDRRLIVTIPRVLAQALTAAGYTRVRVSVDADGILLRPYKGAPRSTVPPVLDLPEWDSA